MKRLFGAPKQAWWPHLHVSGAQEGTSIVEECWSRANSVISRRSVEAPPTGPAPSLQDTSSRIDSRARASQICQQVLFDNCAQCRGFDLLRLLTLKRRLPSVMRTVPPCVRVVLRQHFISQGECLAISWHILSRLTRKPTQLYSGFVTSILCCAKSNSEAIPSSMPGARCWEDLRRYVAAKGGQQKQLALQCLKRTVLE